MNKVAIRIGDVAFANPIMVASGTFGYAQEFDGLLDFSQIGAIVTKTVTLEPRTGNPPPRIWETAAGMLNSIGLPNVGVEEFIAKKMPFLRNLATRIVVNVAGKTGDDYVRIVERLQQVDGIDAYELNFSCPNVKQGGMSFSADAQIAERVTADVRKKSQRPLIVKLTPNVTSIADIGKAVEQGGADAVSAINTLVGMAVDVKSRRPRLSTITGGLSGPAIKPIALAKVYELCRKLTIPVVAIGGIMNLQDALEFFVVGATAVQIGTANFINPACAAEIAQGLHGYCRAQNLNLQELIGSLRVEK
ncbi:MAG TPA: dihydroorotate dehydrogenase [bacterium]|nr:dihydroorotate dehydrogenase [bacterium]HOX84611.1 dihydroorotate dehydrogenase [bacterium]HPG45334.1 dihydroorotate dehydrogenase [bacterium]HPM98947.1 dihydroorotate dehydrogenase [bacterium]